jgi:hypothetical protein
MPNNISITRDPGSESMDITEPEHGFVTVEIDYKRKVLYVHTEGRTVLRICKWTVCNVERNHA